MPDEFYGSGLLELRRAEKDGRYEVGAVLGAVGLTDEVRVQKMLAMVCEQILATYRRDRERWGESIVLEWKVKARSAFSGF